MSTTEKQTYRDAIQKLQQDSNTIYESCGALRDAAALNEKEYWNKLRGLLHEVYCVFGALDNSLPKSRATMPLNGRY